ncbi:MAG: PF20097 family protein [Phycisphaerales bacterium]
MNRTLFSPGTPGLFVPHSASTTMAQQPTCLVCHKVMELGFLTDLGHGNEVHIPRWCTGTPEPSFWSGEAKTSPTKAGLKVVAYRCPQCEALRLYAPAHE